MDGDMTLLCAQTAACLVLAIAGALESTQPPPVADMPLSVTSYWIFDDSGVPVAWNGQANGDPDHYANGEATSPDHAGKVAACIQDWTLLGWTTAVTFWWGGEQMTVACYDNFGDEDYRRPFYHAGYGQWVVPIDILSPLPYHGLVWDWSRDVVQVGEID